MIARGGVAFSFEQACRTMGVTPERLERLVEEGKIGYVREGPRTLIPREAILAYLAEVSAVPLKQRQK